MISAVIPLYNGEKYIEATLQDVLGSTEQDIEVLIVDDGSKDSGAEIVKRIAGEDSRVRYFRKENGGIASARNYGLDQAKGEYICFLDQDDFVKPDMFSIVKEDIEKTGADFVQAGASECIDGVVRAEQTMRGQIVLKNGSERYCHYLQSLVMRGCSPHPEYKVPGSIWSFLFRTEFLRDNDIRFESFCDYEDDWIVCIKAYRSAKVICLEKRTVYCWRVHNQSESHNRILRDRYIEDFYARYCRLNAFMQEAVAGTGLTTKQHRFFAREMQKRALLWTLSNETGRGIRGRSMEESKAAVKTAVLSERKKGFQKGIVLVPLSTTGYRVSRGKKLYHILRETCLTFLLLHHMEGAAIYLNKKFLHGRWHI
ncbi:MAG: glycosyltransferase [Roseburia sp.]|nr:glycosyltransferase [Roseburia sp.]